MGLHTFSDTTNPEFYWCLIAFQKWHFWASKKALLQRKNVLMSFQ